MAYKPSPSQSSIQSLAAAYTDSDDSDAEGEVDNHTHRRRKLSHSKEERRLSTEKRRSGESKANRPDFYEESADYFIPPDPYTTESPKKKNQFDSPYIDDSPIGDEPPPPAPNNRSESPETPTPAGVSSLMKKNSSVALVNYVSEELDENADQIDLIDNISVDEFHEVNDIHIGDVLMETETVETSVIVSSSNEDLDVHDYLERTLEGHSDSQNSTPEVDAVAAAVAPEVQIPPAPSGICDPKLQAKINRLLERKRSEGYDPNAAIQRRKDFRNPSIYEKLIQHLEIDEIGSNFPKEVFDPHGFRPSDSYEELAKAQKIVMDRLEKEKQPMSKVMDRTAANLALIEESKRKSRWGNTAASTAAVANLTHSHSSGSLPVLRPTPPMPNSVEKVKSSDPERHGSREKTFGSYKKPKLVL